MDLRAFYPPRPEESRKGDFGRVLVVGGSHRYAGAPAFNALAALRAGADLVTVAAPRRAADLVASYSPDLITQPLGAPYPTLDEVEPLLPDFHALVLGGGVVRMEEAHRELRRIVDACQLPMVLDAEALHAIAQRPQALEDKLAILTPHAGEFRVLTGEAWPQERAAREEAARRAGRRFGATLVVKGRWDVVSDGARVHVDEEGSPYLTKGGYGDLLAGAAGALLARGHAPFESACAAAFLVGRAGTLAARELGESALASDALARFPAVIPRPA